MPGTPGGEIDFECKVRPRHHADQIESKIIRASDEEDAVSKLQSQGFLVVSVHARGDQGKRDFLTHLAGTVGLRESGTAKSEDAHSHQVERRVSGGRGRKRGKTSLVLFKSVTTRDLISFAIQLSALLQSGVPLIRALQIVQRGVRNSYFIEILEKFIGDLNHGLSFSYSLKSFSKVFPPVWINLVEIGEASGNLPQVLKEVAHYQESAQRVKGKVISAFFYPAVLSAVATGAIAFLLVYIVPKFQDIFSSHKTNLPALTQAVIFASDILRNYAPVVVLIFLALIAAVTMIIRTPGGRYGFDQFRLRMPLMGKLLLEVSIIRFARGLSTLLRSGVPILQALEISGKLAQNTVVEKVILDARLAVKGGQSLGEQLERNTLFPVFMTQLVSIGEESGELDRFLDIISNYYEESVDTFLSRLSTLLEPLLLVFMGAVIGTLVVAMFLPIIEISTGGVM